MTVSISPIDPTERAFFAGEVSGIDLTKPLSANRWRRSMRAWTSTACWCSTDQRFDDETQLAFSRNFGDLEEASGDLNWGKARRLQLPLVNDISNLDNDNQVLARDSRRRLFSLGNRLWHSDSSFKAVPAKYSLLSGRDRSRPRAGTRIRRHARGV